MYEFFERRGMRNPARSAVRVRKECVDGDSKFYLGKVQGGHYFYHTSRSTSIAQRHARSAQADWSLRIFKQEERLKESCCKDCTESKGQ